MRAEHRISKLYYLAWTVDKWAAYQAALKRLVIKVDDVERQATPWPDWAVTTRLDTTAVVDQVWRAVSCHESQMGVYQQLYQPQRTTNLRTRLTEYVPAGVDVDIIFAS